MSISWKYVTPVSEELIEAVEKENNIQLPDDLRDVILIGNNGYPSKEEFNSKNGKSHLFKKLLSYNRNDVENIYVAIEVLEEFNIDLFPIADDPFGNLICLDKTKIVFWDHETDEIEEVADSMTEFLNSLY